MVVIISHNQILIIIDNASAAADDDDNIVNINILQIKLTGRRVIESKSNYQRAI